MSTQKKRQEVAGTPAISFVVHRRTYKLTSQSFGVHEIAFANVAKLLEKSMGDSDPEQLDDEAFLQVLADKAVRTVTETWQCWRPGYFGVVPTVKVTPSH